MYPATADQFDRLRPVVIQLQDLAKGSTAPLFWRDDAGKLRNGTMTMVDTGVAVLGITAGHVADACVSAYCRDTERSCQVGGAEFDAKSRFIARHPTLDLATFRLSYPFAAPARAYPTVAPEWPPRPLEVGDLVLFGGYPRAHRVEEAASIDFYFLSLIGRLDSASENTVGFVLRLDNCMSTGPAEPQAAKDLGGWSGGPVFRIVEWPIVRLELAAIIYECVPVYEIARAHLLSSVSAEGNFT